MKRKAGIRDAPPPPRVMCCSPQCSAPPAGDPWLEAGPSLSRAPEGIRQGTTQRLVTPDLIGSHQINICFVYFAHWTHLVGGLFNAEEDLLKGRDYGGCHSHLRRKSMEHKTRKPEAIVCMPLHSALSQTLHRGAEAIQSICHSAPTDQRFHPQLLGDVRCP